MKEPDFDFISRVPGIIKARDRPWEELCIDPEKKTFIKHVCCQNIEVILRQYSYASGNKQLIYYIGQCPRCEKVYFIYA